jgi:hypothetical protein
MTAARDMARLGILSQLVLDQRLMSLRGTTERRDQSLMQIAALDRTDDPADLPPVAADQVALRYRLWADRRRTELNLVLARQTAEWLQARQDAAQAFGRVEALRALAARLDKGR